MYTLLKLIRNIIPTNVYLFYLVMCIRGDDNDEEKVVTRRAIVVLRKSKRMNT